MDKMEAMAGRTFIYDVKDEQNKDRKWTSIVEGELECLSYDIQYEKWHDDYIKALDKVVLSYNMWSMYDRLANTNKSVSAGDTASAYQPACCAAYAPCAECPPPAPPAEENGGNNGGVGFSGNEYLQANSNNTLASVVSSESHILKLNSNLERTAVLRKTSYPYDPNGCPLTMILCSN